MGNFCRIYTISLALVFSLLMPRIAQAQMRIIPKEKLDSIVNPKLAPVSGLLAFDKEIMDAGTIAEGGGVKRFDFKFKNISAEDVEITRLITNCSCVAASAEPKIVKAGHDASIKILYYPEGHPGKFVRTIRVYASTEKSKEKFALAAFLKLKIDVTEN